MKITRHILTAVDYGDSCDGKACVVGVYRTHKEAHDEMVADAAVRASEIYEAEVDAENSTEIYDDGASVGRMDEHGCEWKIENVEIEVTDEELQGGGDNPSSQQDSTPAYYSPFSKIKVTAQVDWDVDDDDDGEAPDREVRFEIDADPDMFKYDVIDDSDPLNWRIDMDALDELIGDRLSDKFGFCHKGFTYSFTPFHKGWETWSCINDR